MRTSIKRWTRLPLILFVWYRYSIFIVMSLYRIGTICCCYFNVFVFYVYCLCVVLLCFLFGLFYYCVRICIYYCLCIVGLYCKLCGNAMRGCDRRMRCAGTATGALRGYGCAIVFRVSRSQGLRGYEKRKSSNEGRTHSCALPTPLS